MNKNFIPIDTHLYSSGRGPKDLRLGDQLCTLNQSEFVFIGYPDDEGINLNGGRIGAKQGPNLARKYLYKMTTNGFISNNSFKLFDYGNLSMDKELSLRHEIAKKEVLSLLNQNKKIISVGGGHDYAYPDGAGFLTYCQNNFNHKPLIINIDAHLDVRPTTNGLSSGTPFYRLINEFSDFDFYEIGIQPQCNAQEHINWCHSKGVKILTHDEILLSGKSFAHCAGEFLSEVLLKPRPCFLSIDIDAFSSSFAMGCSQSWPAGLTPNEFFPFFDILKQRLNILNLGTYELSPPLDLDDRTSKLVAQIIYRYLQS